MKSLYRAYIFLSSAVMALIALSIMLNNNHSHANPFILIDVTGIFILAAIIIEFLPKRSEKANVLFHCYKIILLMLAFLLIMKKILLLNELTGITLGCLYILICGYFSYHFGYKAITKSGVFNETRKH